MIGSEAKITEALAGAFSSPTAFAQPTITAGTSTHFAIIYAIERSNPIANGLLLDKKTPVVNRATGSVQPAKADKNKKIKPAPGAYEQFGCRGGAPTSQKFQLHKWSLHKNDCADCNLRVVCNAQWYTLQTNKQSIKKVEQGR